MKYSVKTARQKFCYQHGKRLLTSRQKFINFTAKVCEHHRKSLKLIAEAEAVLKRKWWSLALVPIRYGLRKMADRHALDEEDAIRDYFRKGLTYDDMLAFLDKYHGIEMSVVTLKRRIKEYGLKRRNGN